MTDNELKLGIKSLSEIDFYLRNLPARFHSEIKAALLSYTVDLNLKSEKEMDLLSATIHVTAKYTDEKWLRAFVWPELTSFSKEQIELLMHLTLKMDFNISPFPEGEKLDDSILSLIAEMCISTARGVVFSKTQGSVLANHLLPYMNVTKI